MNNQRAANWYLWLRISPIFTLPTLLAGSIIHYFLNSPDFFLGLILTLESAAWHLILLVPALNKSSQFVRWHGRQMLALASVRTALAFLLISQFVEGNLYGAIFLTLFGVWAWGTSWGRKQAIRGECTLAGWFGVMEFEDIETPKPKQHQATPRSSDNLVNIVRYSIQKSKRVDALQKLHERGMVESLDESSAAETIQALLKGD